MNERSLGKVRFCARESAQRGDSLLGTATESGCYLLVECGGVWPARVADLLLAPGIPESLSNALREFIAWCPKMVHPLLIKQSGKSGSPRIYVIHPSRAAGRCLSYANCTVGFFAALQEAYWNPGYIGDIALVCTHGKRDKCCAKLGEPVYDRLRIELGDKFDVFQCSHVGGDRFAANVLWLPHGIFLGHVHTGLSATIDKLRAKSIPLEKLRGNASLPSAAQYFEGHWRTKLALEYPGAFELVEYREKDVNGKLFCFVSLRDNYHAGVREGYVSISRSTSSVLASCNTDAEAYPRIFELIDETAYNGAI